VAVSIGQLARRLPSAGGFYTYAARGLHPTVGFLVGWGYAFVEPLVAPLLYLIFGNLVASTLQTEFGWSYDWPRRPRTRAAPSAWRSSTPAWPSACSTS
jgi:amino acid transporter